MADVNVTGDGGSSNAVLAIVIIALLALLAWFFLRGPAEPAGADIKVDINTPADAGGAPRPPQ
jgi:hypothetical protein